MMRSGVTRRTTQSMGSGFLCATEVDKKEAPRGGVKATRSILRPSLSVVRCQLSTGSEAIIVAASKGVTCCSSRRAGSTPRGGLSATVPGSRQPTGYECSPGAPAALDREKDVRGFGDQSALQFG